MLPTALRRRCCAPAGRAGAMAPLQALALLAILPGAAAAFLRSFGSTPNQLQPGPPEGKRGTGVQHICLGAPPVVFLNHTLEAVATLGVVDQFWLVNGGEVSLAKQGLRLEVSYWFDGEAEPSIVFEPAMANGNGWAAVFQGGEWRNGQQQAGDLASTQAIILGAIKRRNVAGVFDRLLCDDRGYLARGRGWANLQRWAVGALFSLF